MAVICYKTARRKPLEILEAAAQDSNAQTKKIEAKSQDAKARKLFPQFSFKTLRLCQMFKEYLQELYFCQFSLP